MEGTARHAHRKRLLAQLIFLPLVFSEFQLSRYLLIPSEKSFLTIKAEQGEVYLLYGQVGGPPPPH